MCFCIVFSVIRVKDKFKKYRSQFDFNLTSNLQPPSSSFIHKATPKPSGIQLEKQPRLTFSNLQVFIRLQS